VTFLYLLGDIQGQAILDVACRAGLYSRLLKRAGAQTVVGVDVSGEIIRVAKKEESKRQDGVLYQVYDALALPVLGAFDVVTAGFLLTYAKTKDELATMCQNLYNNLSPQGRLVTIVTNPGPVFPKTLSHKYGGTIHRLDPPQEGNPCELEFHLEPPISAYCYYWSQETIEGVVRDTGFTRIRWTKPFVSFEGLEQFGEDFWMDFLDRPPQGLCELSEMTRKWSTSCCCSINFFCFLL
jgi:SAM-dependent methyltransferase